MHTIHTVFARQDYIYQSGARWIDTTYLLKSYIGNPAQLSRNSSPPLFKVAYGTQRYIGFSDLSLVIAVWIACCLASLLERNLQCKAIS